MVVRVMIPEINENQIKYLKAELLKIINESRQKSLPINYIETKIKELFD